MKNLLIILLAISASIIFSSEAVAQYSIPSYSVEIVSDPTTFEEEATDHSQLLSTKPIFIQAPNGKEERKMNVRIRPISPAQSANATIEIYSLDGVDVLGPFYITDAAVFEQVIDEREWGVRVLSASENNEMSVWID